MQLTDHKWEYVYRSGQHDLLKDFYEPALGKAVQYDRAVGYFSTNVLMSNLKGISSLIKNNGKMRLIIGHPLKEDEYQALKHGINTYQFVNKIDQKLEQILKEAKFFSDVTLKLFAYLVASQRLEMKYAFRRAGMYHEKIGIITDKNQNQLVFQGSANETTYALENGYNAESITVYKSWGAEFDLYGKNFVNSFQKLWENQQENTFVMNMPSAQYEKIKTIIDVKNISPHTIEEKSDSYNCFFEESINLNPKTPKYIGQNKFELMQHQKDAIKSWWTADKEFTGILELATGSGKTITAISAATLLFEQLNKQKKKLVLIITVPYIELAKQWVENLNLFNIYPIECWDNSNVWVPTFRDISNRFKIGSIDFFAAVVVNRTLTGDRFQSLINEIPAHELMIIGDECHHFGGKKISEFAPEATYRLGLSATPFSSDEEDYDSPFPDVAKERILKYFNSIVARYTLEDAIVEGVLCNYNYHIIETYLTEEEQEEYDELSREIGILVAIDANNGLNENQRSKLSMLTGRRAMLLGNAENKYSALAQLTKNIPKEFRPLSLFYCGAGHDRNSTEVDYNDTNLIRVIDRVSQILVQNGWTTSQFTSRESTVERKSRMENFTQQHIDALVTIRVLDEGVDVPACQSAFLLASTKNKRQYVQRRGRVLRKYEGKDIAEIYDFVVLPHPTMGSQYGRRLIDSELERIDEFSSLALNKLDISNKIKNLGLRHIKGKYD